MSQVTRIYVEKKPPFAVKAKELREEIKGYRIKRIIDALRSGIGGVTFPELADSLTVGYEASQQAAAAQAAAEAQMAQARQDSIQAAQANEADRKSVV